MYKFRLVKPTEFQEKLMKWGKHIIEDNFPNAGIYGADSDGVSVYFECGFEDCDNNFREPDEKLVNDMITTINKLFPTIKATKLIYDDDCPILAGIRFTPTNFWFEDMIDCSRNFHFIRRRACDNKIPFDKDLNKKLGTESWDVYWACRDSEDGFGIEGKFGRHNIDFRVIAIDYRPCDGGPEDPDWTYCLVPDLWFYSGEWDGRHIEGLASSNRLAVGKMLQAIYKDAEKHDQEVSSALKANLFEFRTYGFC